MSQIPIAQVGNSGGSGRWIRRRSWQNQCPIAFTYDFADTLLLGLFFLPISLPSLPCLLPGISPCGRHTQVCLCPNPRNLWLCYWNLRIWQKNFADVILSWRSRVNQKGPGSYKGPYKREAGEWEKEMGQWKQRCGWCGHEPRNAGSLYNWEKERDGFFPRFSRRNADY